VKREQSGIVYLRDGKIVHAEGSATTHGREALLEIAGWDNIEFAYDSEARAPETISMSWDEALVQALVRSKEGKQEEAMPVPTGPEPVEPPRPRRRGFFAALRRN
jgi:hypothetical protein